MHAIHWPAAYLPGTTDNFVSNETIAAGLSAADVWPWLARPALWPGYYSNAADVQLPPGTPAAPADELAAGLAFFFTTFGFPVDAQCVECVAPADGQPGRVAWHGWAGAPGSAQRLDVHHAWLVEDLDGGRVRILTQETQRGAPAVELARTRPNPMLLGHQDWLGGLVAAARGAHPAVAAPV